LKPKTESKASVDECRIAAFLRVGRRHASRLVHRPIACSAHRVEAMRVDCKPCVDQAPAVAWARA
jgi:hypothetical protein